MSELNLTLESRALTGKKLSAVRAAGKIPSVIYGAGEPVLAQSIYNDTERVLHMAGYHSPVNLDIDGKKTLALVKSIAIDPVSRKIINIEFQAISSDALVEAVTPIVVVDFEASDASKLYHFSLNNAMESISVKAKPADLPSEIRLDASKLVNADDKLTIADLKLPKGVELADKNLSSEQVIVSVYDPAAEAAAREAADKKEEAAAPAEEAAPASEN